MRFRDRSSAPFSSGKMFTSPESRPRRASRTAALRAATMLDSLEARRMLALLTVDTAQSVSATNFHTITDAVAAAGATTELDDSIDVAAGAYAENVLINTPLSLRGARFGIDPRADRGSGESIVTGQIAIAAPGVTVDGFTVLVGDVGASAPAVSAIYVNENSAVISNNIVTGGGSGTGLLSGAGVTLNALLEKNVVSSFAKGAHLVGNGTITLTASRFAGNAIGVRMDGQNLAATISQNQIINNMSAGVEIDLATLTGTASVAVDNNTLSNPNASQIALLGGDVADSVTLSANAVTLEGTSTYVNTVASTPVSGLSTSTFTIIRSTNEDTPIDIDLSLDGTALNPPDTTGLNGSVSVAGNVVTYTPALNFNGNTSFTFTTVGGASGSVNITVNAVNDVPTVAGDESFTLDEGGSYLLTTDDVSASDVDLPAQTLSYSVTGVTGGQLEFVANPGVAITSFTQSQLAAGEVRYVHAGGESASASIVYTVSDGVEATSSRTITIVVVPVNDPPLLSPVAPLGATEGQTSVITSAQLNAVDVDTSAAELVYRIQTLPVRGSLFKGSVALAANDVFTQADINAGLITYQHDGTETTSDSFTFTLSDGTTTLGSETVSINVSPANDPPTADNGSIATDEDLAVSGTLSGSDVDSSSLTYAILAQPANGVVVITDASTGAYTFTPNANWNGSTSFTFQISDGTAVSNVATVSLTVNPTSDVPVATNSNVSTTEDNAINGTLVGNDPDGGALTYSIVDQSAHGTVLITDASTGAFTFTPDANWNGTTSFTFHLSDGTTTSNTATVTVTVTAVNDGPVSTSIPPVAVDEGSLATVALNDYFSDVDENDVVADVLTYSLSGAPSFVTVNPTTGVVTIAPGALDSGTYSFTAIATDGSSSSASTAISLTVNNVVNNAPAFTNLPNAVSISENAVVPVFDVDASDPDAGQSLVYSIVGGNGAGLFAIDPNTGVVTLTGPLDAEAAAQHTLVIRVTDNGPPAPEFTEGNLVANVTDVNDLPTLVTLNGPATIGEGAAALYSAIASDADVDAVLSYKWFVDDVEQSGETSPTFSITFANQGSHVVRVEVSDRGAAAATDSKTLAVTDVAPTVPLFTTEAVVNEGASFTLNIGGITDPGVGDVASIGQVAVWWQDGTYTLINETTNADLLAIIRAGGSVSVSHVYTDGQNASRSMTVSVYDSVQSYVQSTSIVVNNVAPTGNFAAITPTVQAGSSAFVNWFGQTDVSAEDRVAGLRYTYVLDVNVPGGDGIYNAGDILIAGDGTYENASPLSQIQIPGTLLATAGDYRVLGMLIDKDGSPILTKQVFINVTPSTLQVVSLGGDHSGFTMVFNRQIDLSVLNLYDGTDLTNDTADITLLRANGQTIRGSLVINAARNGFDFLVTGGILPQGTYTVRMNSGVNALKDLFGSALDGDMNGIAGGNYAATFGVNAPPGPVLSTPDFSRGPGQPIDIIPGNTNSDLPITMNSPIAVSSINFQMRYDQTLMDVTSVIAGAGLPAGWTVDFSVVPGGVNISLIKSSGSATDIPAGSRELVRVIASVPNVQAIYGKSHVLSFASIVVNGNASIEGTADRSVHKVVFVGDANRDGTLNVGDSALIQTIVLGTVSGFDAYPIVDPVIIVDSSRNGAVDSQDASNAALSGFTGTRPADVPAFTPVTVPITVGTDPTFSLPTNLVGTPGSTITVPLNVIDDARGVQAGQIRINYDTALLDLNDLGVIAGSLISSGWQVVTNVNDAEGWVEIGFYSGTAIAGGSAITGTLINLQFVIASNATEGVTPLSIATPLNTPASPTSFYSRQGNLLATTALSGSLLIDVAAPTVAQTAFNFMGNAHSYTVVFSENVGPSIAAGDFELVNLTTGTSVNVVVSNISSDGKTVTLTFTNTGGITNSILKDGDYRLRVRAGQIADLAGRVNAAEVDSTFFFMNADLNHDRAVNFDDLLLLAQHYGETSGSTFANGDANYDGQVSFDDLLVLAQRYGTSLISLPRATAANVRRTRWSDSVIA